LRGDKAFLRLSEQGVFEWGQSAAFEGLDGGFNLVDRVAVSFQNVNLLGIGDGVAVIIFQNQAHSGHGNTPLGQVNKTLPHP
jgi:hypothetical protein